MKNLTLALGATLLASCATTATQTEADQPTDKFIAAMGVMSDDTARISSGDYISSAWISDEFDGTQTRDLDGNRLFWTVDNRHPSQGGWDGSVSLPEDVYGNVSVAEVGAGARACTSYSVDIETAGTNSKWWAGPKVSVNWAAMESDSNPGDWYENYIIETGSDTAQAWLDGMRSWTEVEDLGTTVIEGATYRHFKMRFVDWWQFWSFREDQRDAGSVPIKPILDKWVQHGLPADLEVDGVKANVETYGPMKVRGQMAATFNRGGLTAASGACEVPATRVSMAP